MPIGKTKDRGYQIGVRKTFAIPVERAWKLIVSEQGLNAWLGKISEGTVVKGSRFRLQDASTGSVRIYNVLSHLRVTWQPANWLKASTIQVRVIPNAEKTVISFHQENLPGPQERIERQAHFKQALQDLAEIIGE